MSAGHGQQNGESLNNIFKTLVSLYSLGESCSDGGPIESPNKGEFIGYFIIFQIGNKGEVTRTFYYDSYAPYCSDFTSSSRSLGYQ